MPTDPDVPRRTLRGTPTGVRWPLALLVLGLGLTAVAAIQAQRSVSSHRRTAELLFRDYASFASWSFGKWALVEVSAPARRALGPVAHREVHMNPEIPDAADLAHYHENSADEERSDGDVVTPDTRPRTFFAFEHGTDTLKVVGDPIPASDRRWIVDTLGAVAASFVDRDDRIRMFVRGSGDASRLVAVAPMPMRHGTAVYGVVIDAAAYRASLASVLRSRELLPGALVRGRPNDSLLAVQVADPQNRLLWSSGDFPDWDLLGEDSLPAAVAGLRVRASLRPGVAESLIIGGLPASRLPILLGLLALSSALSVLAVVQLRREGEFARMRADFVSSVSHELRTPLAQIRLYLETILLGRASTEEQRTWSLRHIDRETRRLTHLVENVLHYARSGHPEAAQPAAEPTPVAEEVRRIVEEFAPLAASRRSTVEAVTGAEPVVALAREPFRRALINLLDNAVKFGPQGQTVTVAVERTPAGAVRVSVTDQGPGVDEADRERIWLPFHRGASAPARAAGGSGLGLAIVRDAVVAMGGRVRCEGAPGGGARFVIELAPLDADEPTHVDEPARDGAVARRDALPSPLAAERG